MSTYRYYEACGYLSEPWEATDDAAAEAHVLTTLRSKDNPDFDGDQGGIVRVCGLDEDGGEDREQVAFFDGENMIDDPFDERRAFNGMGPGWN